MIRLGRAPTMIHNYKVITFIIHHFTAIKELWSNMPSQMFMYVPEYSQSQFERVHRAPWGGLA
jgi:hypothetical protein